jgi:hypothetical protein
VRSAATLPAAVAEGQQSGAKVAYPDGERCQGVRRNGGMIEISLATNRLRFNINVDNAQKAGLRISSNLLQLAAVVEKGNAQ